MPCCSLLVPCFGYEVVHELTHITESCLTLPLESSPRPWSIWDGKTSHCNAVRRRRFIVFDPKKPTHLSFGMPRKNSTPSSSIICFCSARLRRYFKVPPVRSLVYAETSRESRTRPSGVRNRSCRSRRAAVKKITCPVDDALFPGLGIRVSDDDAVSFLRHLAARPSGRVSTPREDGTKMCLPRVSR